MEEMFGRKVANYQGCSHWWLLLSLSVSSDHLRGACLSGFLLPSYWEHLVFAVVFC